MQNNVSHARGWAHLVVDVQRKDEDGDEEVRDRERDREAILRRLQMLVGRHRLDDEPVASEADERHQREADADGHRLALWHGQVQAAEEGGIEPGIGRQPVVQADRPVIDAILLGDVLAERVVDVEGGGSVANVW